MANKEIPFVPAADILDGSEQVHGVQAGNSRRITVENIATFKRPPMSIPVSFLPKPTANETLLFYTLVESITFPANFAGSSGDPGINATATTTFTVYANPTFTGDAITGGTIIGTIDYSPAGAYTFATIGGVAIALAAGESIGVRAQASPDATATGSFTLKAARTE
jgi:hypothetical protein